MTGQSWYIDVWVVFEIVKALVGITLIDVGYKLYRALMFLAQASSIGKNPRGDRLADRIAQEMKDDE